MIIFEANFTDLNVHCNDRTTKKIKIKNASLMNAITEVRNFMDGYIHINSWNMKKMLGKTDRFGSDIDWSSGCNHPINSGAYLAEFIEELEENM